MSDLDQREIKFSELASGSDKTREFFREMIQQASAELDFEVDNMPLMIEAIPIPGECLILVVTRVKDPEEFQQRFANLSKLLELLSEGGLQSSLPLGEDFSDGFDDDLDDEDYSDIFVDTGEDDLLAPILDVGENHESADTDDPADVSPLGLIAPFAEAIVQAKEQKKKQEQETEQKSSDATVRLYGFRDLDEIIRLSAFLSPFYKGESSLYKDNEMSDYYLILEKKESSDEDFKRACIIASDYGDRLPISYASTSFCREHLTLMFEGDALDTLNQLN